MSELLMKEVESVSTCPGKPEERLDKVLSFLLVDEQENLKVANELANVNLDGGC